MLTCPKDICVDNGAMIAWTGWEIKNAEQDVDIRNITVNGHRKIPLGNFRTDDSYIRLAKISKKQSMWKKGISKDTTT